MKPLRVALIGSAGRMGKTIVDLAARDPKIDIVAQCDMGGAIADALKDCDVAIDFSQPTVTHEICDAALQNKCALVIGTTGHSDEQRQTIEAAAKKLPIVFASNFSIGVNALFALTRHAAEILGPDFNLEIVEAHHHSKKDAPSGTAKTLAQILKTARKIDNEIPIQSIREGEVVGEHTIIFSGPNERLELVHRAGGREIFARGALHAAQWIVGKPPQLYSMQEVLGLTKT
ncbi:MAG: 4-hydroxy-tetrahydrodipicolinate reductase [Verrucomicrobiota bacterium]|jgi:4-hydroxy-tetrahydrodipicolinate reductase